ncbi:MAG: hypothetical protein GF421_00610 [Candidatus Aminicenantes bacterium]|nr:hypothetical protein [Candidatus Aminicenantes bacterium]
MKCFYFLKTRLWLAAFPLKSRYQKGSVTLITAFMVFLFTTLGLTTLFLTQVNLKLNQHRKNAVLLDYASENGIKQGFIQLSEQIAGIQSPVTLSQQKFTDLSKDALLSGEDIIAFLLSTQIPIETKGQWAPMKWTCQTSFTTILYQEFAGYFITEHEVQLKSLGTVYQYHPVKTQLLSCTMTIFTGHIPLSALTLIKDRDSGLTSPKDFLEQNSISVHSAQENRLSPQIYVTEKELIPDQASQQIQEALNIKTFKPQDLSDQRLRQVLGLEIKDEPVPEGVYLIRDDLGLGGIYIQGDVEEMVLSVEHDFQVIHIVLETGVWEVRFNPEIHQTLFLTPYGEEIFDLTPKGIVIVSGQIKCLRGKEQKASVLNSISFSIITSEAVTITDDLTHEGLEWIDSVPYVKDSHSQLHIFAGGNSIVREQNRTGGLFIENSSAKDIKIQASLTTSRGGFSIKGENKTANILGSVHASQYNTQQNQLNLYVDRRFLSGQDFTSNSPLTQNPICHLAQFKIIEWIENE